MHLSRKASDEARLDCSGRIACLNGSPARHFGLTCVATSETGAAWNEFFADLVARDLAGVRLVTSHAHAGLVEAIAANLPGATWQRCRTHYAEVRIMPRWSVDALQGTASVLARSA